jgi:hypothetical protein
MVAVVVVVAVALVAAVVIVLLTRDGGKEQVAGDGSPQAGPSPTVTVTPPPVVTSSTSVGTSPTFTAEEEALLARVPEGHRSSCVSESDPYPDGRTARLTCTGEGGEVVGYAQMPDNASLYSAYDAIKADTPEGKCADLERADGPYNISGTPAGRLLCFRGGTAGDPEADYAWIMWTDDQLLILSWAYRTDGDRTALYDWWLNKSGPTH